jgi:cyclase
MNVDLLLSNADHVVVGDGTALEHASVAITDGRADAVAMADILHYKRGTLADIRAALRNASLDVRHP